MAMKSRSTFKKRQKELARIEKQRDKAARRMERKQQQPEQGENSDIELNPDLVQDPEVLRSLGFDPHSARPEEDDN